MASFPGGKVHRVGNRRKLGRGQMPAIPVATITGSAVSGDVVKFVSNIPIVFVDPLPLTIAVVTYVSQVQVSATEVDVTLSGSPTGHAWSLPSNVGVTFMGGGTAATSGTF